MITQQKKNVNFDISKSPIIAGALLEIASKYTQAFLITDQNIAHLYGDEMIQCLSHSGIDTKMIVLPPGEGSKTREMKAFLEDQLLAERAHKKSPLIAFGGGVISDLVGFTAATFLRGVPYYLIPTSLMAMVDASIGGKVAVNTPAGKNLIGAIYLPEGVICEPGFLYTLPEKEYRAAFMEVIKCGLIWDKTLIDAVERQQEQLAIETAAAIKKEIVAKDLFDHTVRRILNFGHTVGHALEALYHFQILHGEALWYGLLLESHLSFQRGFLQEKELNRIVNLLMKESYRQNAVEKIERERLFQIMQLDKKLLHKPRIVMITQIGTCHPFDGSYCTPIEFKEVTESIHWFQNEIQNQ